MRAYKLPNGTWVDLDSIQKIGELITLRQNRVCKVQFAFQNKEQYLELDGMNNPRNYIEGCSYNTEAKRKKHDEKTKQAYNDLTRTWSGKERI